MQIHGTLDPLFPWYGGLFHGVPYTVGSWRELNNCEEEGVEDWLGTGVLRTVWKCEESTEVVQVAVEGGGHVWPPQRIDPERLMWDWFTNWV